MNVIVDAFGGDNAPKEIIKGCIEALKEYNVNITLVGNRSKLEKIASKEALSLNDFSIVHSESIINMDDAPDVIMKSKKDSSMSIGLELLAQNKGDIFISAGNSGALAVGSTMIVKRMEGISRAAFAAVLPSKSHPFMLIDVGANVDCRPNMLQQFGLMGYIYMKNVIGIKNPKVALANIGTEQGKGGILQRKAYELLKSSNLNFIGNIEARDILSGVADVVVADGFTGNIILKTFEGVALNLLSQFKGILKNNLKTDINTNVLISEFNELQKTLDYNEYGGAPIIGLKAPVFKAHGNSNAKTFKNAIRLSLEYKKNNVISEIKNEIFSQSKSEAFN